MLENIGDNLSVSLDARWTLVEDENPVETTYTITFVSNGGSSEQSLTVSSESDSIVLPEPTKGGYVFDGWYIDELLETSWQSFIERGSGVSSDMHLYAKWKLNAYILTFESNGGTSYTSISITAETTSITLPEPTKDGYTFVGWYIDEGLGTTFQAFIESTGNVISTNMILYACWIQKTLLITLELNGGQYVGNSEYQFIHGVELSYYFQYQQERAVSFWVGMIKKIGQLALL